MTKPINTKVFSWAASEAFLEERGCFEDFKALMAECKVDTLRGSGPGGQHRNKTETGVRLTHLPTDVRAEAFEVCAPGLSAGDAPRQYPKPPSPTVCHVLRASEPPEPPPAGRSQRAAVRSIDTVNSLQAGRPELVSSRRCATLRAMLKTGRVCAVASLANDGALVHLSPSLLPPPPRSSTPRQIISSPAESAVTRSGIPIARGPTLPSPTASPATLVILLLILLLLKSASVVAGCDGGSQQTGTHVRLRCAAAVPFCAGGSDRSAIFVGTTAVLLTSLAIGTAHTHTRLSRALVAKYAMLSPPPLSLLQALASALSAARSDCAQPLARRSGDGCTN